MRIAHAETKTFRQAVYARLQLPRMIVAGSRRCGPQTSGRCAPTNVPSTANVGVTIFSTRPVRRSCQFLLFPPVLFLPRVVEFPLTALRDIFRPHWTALLACMDAQRPGARSVAIICMRIVIVVGSAVVTPRDRAHRNPRAPRLPRLQVSHVPPHTANPRSPALRAAAPYHPYHTVPFRLSSTQ